MSELLVRVAVVALTIFSYIFDFITFPIYVILQRPFARRKYSLRIRAKPISSDESQITYRNVDEIGKYHIYMLRNRIDTLEKMFRHSIKAHKDKRCLGTRRVHGEEDEVQPSGKVYKKLKLGEYEWRNCVEVGQEATNFGRGIREIGIEARERVVIFAESRAEWLIAAHGLFKHSCTIVTIYATLGEEGIKHGVNETEVTTLITSHELLPKIRKILKDLPNIKRIIYFEDQLQETNTEGFGDVKVHAYKEVLARGSESSIEEVLPTPKDIAFIMYTSGSTGIPKGVLLSHQNCIASVQSLCDVEVFPDDVDIAYLPLAHVFELLAECVAILHGVPLGYSSANTLFDNSTKIMKGSKGDFSVLQPTCMMSVPLILDRIAKAINDKVSQGTPLQRAIFKLAYDYKAKWIKLGFTTPIVDALVFKKVSQVLGGRMRYVLVGGAPFSVNTDEFTRVVLCLRVSQGYGLTETTCSATISSTRDLKYGRVGAPTTVVDLRLINWEEGNYRVTNKPYPQGEIVVGGEVISPGYFKLPGKTAEDFFEEDDKRWFRTGDIGEVHHDGVLKIIDRKKDLVKLQAGEYISLGKIEAEILTCPLVDNVCVYADSTQNFCIALIVANEKALRNLATSIGVTGDFEKLCSDSNVEKAFAKEISVHAKKRNLGKFEIPQKIMLCKEAWTPASGLVTAAFKIRRHEILRRFRAEIDNMYQS